MNFSWTEYVVLESLGRVFRASNHTRPLWAKQRLQVDKKEITVSGKENFLLASNAQLTLMLYMCWSLMATTVWFPGPAPISQLGERKKVEVGGASNSQSGGNEKLRIFTR